MIFRFLYILTAFCTFLYPTFVKALKITPVNGTEVTLNGSRTFVFVTKGSTHCTAPKVHPTTTSVIDPAGDEGLIFEITASSSLSTINGGNAVVTGDEVAIKAEYSGNQIPLFKRTNSYLNASSGYYVKYGTGLQENKAVQFGIALRNLTAATDGTAGAVDGYCKSFSGGGANPNGAMPYSTNTLCYPEAGVAPTSLAIDFMITQTGGGISTTGADVARVNVVMMDCAPGAKSGGGYDIPTFNYSLIPGDGRIRFVNLTNPPSVKSTEPLSKMVLFLSKDRNPSINTEKQVELGTFENNNQIIDNLTNDQEYCLGIGYVNIAGLIMTNSSWSTFLTTPGNIPYCVTPSKVSGALDKSNCFIATVAYGDRNHLFVRVLQKFRDTVLSRFVLGKSFINNYYIYGPYLAQWLLKHDYLRPLMMILLLPVVLLAWSVNSFGLSITFLFFITSLFFVIIFRIFLFRFLHKKRLKKFFKSHSGDQIDF